MALFTDYRDWYFENIVKNITDHDRRAVAELLNMHYGAENRIEIEAGCIAIWGRYRGKDSPEDRKWREICEELTTVYRFPVGTSAGRAGYWRAKSEEITKIKKELKHRIEHTQARHDALDLALFPPEPEELIPVEIPTEQLKQVGLF